MTLDRIDRQILALLQNDGRLSNKELAATVGLAPSTCSERVKRLENEGVILGTYTEVDPARIGVGLQAVICVRLSQHSRDDVQAFHEHILSLPEVLAAYHVTGRWDFMVPVAVRGTEHLRDLAMDGFTTRQEVAQIETALVYEVTRKPGFPDYLSEG